MEKDFLEDCLAKGMSLPQIGELIGRDPSTVGYWVAKHGLVANGRERYSPKGQLDRDELESLVSEGLAIREIAKRLDIHPNRVRYWIKSWGLGPTASQRRTQMIKAARAAGLKEVELECPTHGRAAFAIVDARVRCRRCASEAVSRRRRKVKEILVAEAGGKCSICGYDEHNRALEFHHLDPGEKSFGIGLGGVTRSLEATRAEATKCVLLCANCHALVEAGVLTVPLR